MPRFLLANGLSRQSSCPPFMPKLLPARHAKADHPAHRNPRIVSEPAQWSPSSTRPPAKSAQGAFWAWRSWHRRLVGYGLCQNPCPTGDFCQLCQAALTASCAGAPHLHTLAALRADGPSQHFKPRGPRAPRLSVTRCAMQAVRRCAPCRFSCREALLPRAGTPSKSLAPTRPRHIRQNVPHI